MNTSALREMIGGGEGEGDAPVEVGSDLVRLAGAESVALCATGLEEASTLTSVTYKTKSTTNSKERKRHVRSQRDHSN